MFQLQYKYVCWLWQEVKRLKNIQNQERATFIWAISKVNETAIVLYYKSGNELLGEYYYNWKKRYDIGLCEVCDSNKKITYILNRYFNAIHDAQVWGQTRIYQNLLSYLWPCSYLLRDEVYIPTSYIVSPYKALESNQVRNTTFNKQLLQISIDIKHTFGILKGRCKNLTGLPLILTSEK